MINDGGRVHESGVCCHTPSELPKAEVHIWKAIAPVNRTLAEPALVLTPDEVARAGRYRVNEDAQSFIAARCMLRNLLGGYLSTDPASIRFAYSGTGRPRLEYPSLPDLDFSVSHSTGVILIAFARGRRVGVDLERISATFEFGEVIESFFTEQERTLMESAPIQHKRELFFHLWTVREALVKACGVGIAIPLLRLGFSLKYLQGGCVEATRGSGECYHCESLTRLASYPAAVAYTSPPCTLRFTSWRLPE